jgi:hypothetical protein
MKRQKMWRKRLNRPQRRTKPQANGTRLRKRGACFALKSLRRWLLGGAAGYFFAAFLKRKRA